MLVAIRGRHPRVLVRPRRGSSGPPPASSCVGALVGVVLAKLGYGVNGPKYVPKAHNVECSTNSSPGPSPTPRSVALPAASQQVEADALARPPALDALAALAPADRVKIIAEVKRASPSRGHLADDRRSRRPRGLATRPAAPARSACSPRAAGSAARSTTSRQVRAAVEHPGAAQGLHRRAVPGVRGARRGRRPRAAHRRRARAAARCSSCTA